MTKITHFADDKEPVGWGDSGMPTLGIFATAIQVWSIAQDGPISVNETAMAFNVTPELIRECIEGSCWMYLDGDHIEHDGE